MATNQELPTDCPPRGAITVLRLVPSSCKQWLGSGRTDTIIRSPALNTPSLAVASDFAFLAEIQRVSAQSASLRSKSRSANFDVIEQQKYLARTLPSLETAMANKNDFTPEEWTKVLESIIAAGVAVSAVDPSGLWGTLKRSRCRHRTVTKPL